MRPFDAMEQFDGSPMELYDARPLQEAVVALFGTERERRYPPVPGGHIICAEKSISASYPKDVNNLQDNEGFAVWAMLSLSLARYRDKDASCFIEDFGVWKHKDPTPDQLRRFLDEHRRQIAKCTIECGRHSNVPFTKSFIGYAFAIINPGEIGKTLNAAPYVTLAKMLCKVAVLRIFRRLL